MSDPVSHSTSNSMPPADRVIAFAETLRIPTGRLAGEPLRLAGFQKRFIAGAFADHIEIAVLSVGRGNGKTAVAAVLALAGLLGVSDDQPHREVLIAARTAEQGRIAFNYCAAFIQFLPEEVQARITCLKSPRLEIRHDNPDGTTDYIKVISSDGKSALGASPTMIIMDERASWNVGRGEELEASLLTSQPKRGALVIIISTSGADDLNPFSRWLDEDVPGVYRQEHRPPADLPADDLESLLIANPGAVEGIGASPEDLLKSAERAVKRGGSALTSFRLYTRNERVHDENRQSLVTVDEWMQCETNELPPRTGAVIVGLDVGESASMSACFFYWPESGRCESLGWFPHNPGLLDRGANDRVADRYARMADRGELFLLGDKCVPVAEWVGAVMAAIHGCPVLCIVADRFKQSLIEEGIKAAGLRAPIIWRRNGWYDGGEDVTRFRTAVLDREIKVAPSLLLRSALGDAIVQNDDSGNCRLSKGKSTGRIDSIAAAVLAVAEGSRLQAQPKPKPARVMWA